MRWCDMWQVLALQEHVATSILAVSEPSMFCLVLTSPSPLLSNISPPRHLISDHRVTSRLAPLTSVSGTLHTPWPPICHPSASSLESQSQKSCQFLHSKTNTVSLLQSTHTRIGDKGMFVYPKVVPEWQLSSLLHIIHVLGHHFLPFPSSITFTLVH